MTRAHFTAIMSRVLTLCWVFLFATFTLKLFGIEAFGVEITNSRLNAFIYFVDSNDWARGIINVIKGMIGINLMYACVIPNYKSRALIVNTFVTSYLIVINTLFAGEEWNVLVAILSFSFYAIPLLFTKRLAPTMCLFVLDSIFSFCSLFVLNLSLIEQSQSFAMSAIYSVDYYLLWIITLINIKVGGRKWLLCLDGASASWKKSASVFKEALQTLSSALKVRQTKAKKSIFAGVCTSFTRNSKNFKHYLKLEFRHDLKKNLPPLIFVYGLYLLYAYFIGRVVEAVFLYVAYLALRKLFPKQFHADYIPNIRANLVKIACVCITTITLCVALFNTTGIAFSIFNTVIVALIVDFILYMIREAFDYIADKPFIAKLKMLFSPKHELKLKLNEAGFRNLHEKITLMYCVDNMTMKQVSLEIGYSEQTCKNYFGEVAKVFPELKKNQKKK